MSDPFLDLRALVEGIESQEDAKARVQDAVSLISQVSFKYISISQERNQAQNELAKCAKHAHQIQERVDNYIYECETLAEEIDNICLPAFTLDGLDILSLDEFAKENKITEDALEKMSPNTLMKQRLNYEIERNARFKREFHEINAKLAETREKLSNVRKLFAPIVTKMNDMAASIASFKKRLQ